LAWQRNGLTAGSQDSTLKADRIGGLSDGTPKEAEQAKNLDPPQPYPQAGATEAGPEAGEIDKFLHLAAQAHAILTRERGDLPKLPRASGY
jgi:hypothetical protein